MLINLRNALMAGKRLPYDAEVEYLQSSGTQYINTGIKPGPNTRVEAVFAMTTFTANCGLFGARGNAAADDNSYNLFIISNSGARVRWDWSGSGQYQTSEADTSTDATYVLGAAGGTITRNGATVMSVSASKAAINYPLYVFNFNNVGTPYSTGANARFWSVKIYEGQTLVFDGIPVRKKTVGYLYDRVSGNLFSNAGSGDFALGPDVVPVEYIESSGTQWINTGVVADTNTLVRAKLNCLEYTGDVILGGYDKADNADYRIFQTGAIVFYYDGPGSIYSRIQANNINVVNRVAEIELGNFYITDFTTGVTATRTAYTGMANTPITLCHWGAVDVTGRNSKCRFYHVDIFNGQTAQLALKAIRVGTEGAMMDVLTRRIYRNAGTGAFGYGNDLKYPIPSE